jgi:LacI family transcriptional regulator
VATTIRDVAREAGLSVSAVSRYLNGRLELPEATQLRIQTAVSRLQYTPSAIARRLTSGASETLGFVTTDISYSFFAAIASAAEAEASALGYSLAIFNSRNAIEKELQFLAKLDQHQVDGLLLLTNHTGSDVLSAGINRLQRVVLIDEDVPGANVPRLFGDNVGGGRLAARHFLAHGHHSIAFVAGPAGMISVEERFEGFQAGLAEAGLTMNPAHILKGIYSEEFGAEALEQLFAAPNPPTAIFACADSLAIGILRKAKAMGISVPGDLSLIGYDDMALNDLFDPPLTTIRQSPEDYGRRGVRLLVDLIRGSVVTPVISRVPVELIARKSVAAPRSTCVLIEPIKTHKVDRHQ